VLVRTAGIKHPHSPVVGKTGLDDCLSRFEFTTPPFVGMKARDQRARPARFDRAVEGVGDGAQEYRCAVAHHEYVRPRMDARHDCLYAGVTTWSGKDCRH